VRQRRVGIGAAALSALVLVGAASSGSPPVGGLAQLPGTAGCVHDAAGAADDPDVPRELASACASGTALVSANEVAVSPDGRNVYVATFGAVLAAFARSADGRVQQLPGPAACLAPPSFDLPCGPGESLDGGSDLAISPDGRHVYVAALRSDAVAVLARDAATGALTETGSFGGLPAVNGVAVSPDGRNLYATVLDADVVGVFSRDAATGAIALLPGAAGCVSELLPDDEDADAPACTAAVALERPYDVVVSPDGRHVYVTSSRSDAVASFARDPATGALRQLDGTAACIGDRGAEGRCADGHGLGGPFELAIAPDGRNVYVAAGFDRSADDPLDTAGLAVLRRDPASGALTQLAGPAGCVSDTGTGGACAVAHPLEGTQSVTVSPDGANVYAVTSAESAIVAFARSAATGALAQLPGTAGCVSDGGSAGRCAGGTAFRGVTSVAFSPDGRSAYAPSIYHHALAVLARTAPSPPPPTLRLSARLRPVGARTAASGTAALTLNGAGRLCWTFALRGARPTSALVARAGTNRRVVALGARYARTGCVALPAAAQASLRRSPARYVVEVAGRPRLRGALRRAA
jgi:DNA-binding beta-propeller fold protein YncE